MQELCKAIAVCPQLSMSVLDRRKMLFGLTFKLSAGDTITSSKGPYMIEHHTGRGRESTAVVHL
jgi:hypothetical protein